MKKGIYSKAHRILIVRLIKARQGAGLTQIQAAKKLGRSQSYISKIEVGQRKIDVIELKNIAKVYKHTVSHFLT